MSIRKNRGFTLIELLVVIAIIGILSSVVLASLNTARDKGRDGAIKSSMQTIRVQAELYYDEGSTYGTSATCVAATSMFNDAGTTIDDTIAAAITEITAVASGGTVACDATDQSWAITADLNDGGHWCTDYTGVATEKTAGLGTNTDCSY